VIDHPGPSIDDLPADAKKEADRIVETAFGSRRDRGLAIPTTDIAAVAGTASGVLVRGSADADLLVVGHRGRGGAASRLIGSVGLSCVVHAASTVIVVRG
jgi:nucleotide-binding universal stress UspA family protein